MKKLLPAVLTVLILCSVSAAAIKDSPDGFRGIKWGDPPSSLGAREELAKNQVLSIYTKNGDKMYIGAASLEGIEYFFVRDSLFLAVQITAKNKLNCDRLRDAMIDRYGEPFINEGEKVTWEDDEVVINYEYDHSQGTATVYIFSNSVYEELAAVIEQLPWQKVRIE